MPNKQCTYANECQDDPPLSQALIMETLESFLPRDPPSLPLACTPFQNMDSEEPHFPKRQSE